MGKINIDLGGIMSAFGQQVPEANPLYGAKYDPDSSTDWSYSDGTPITDPNHLKTLTDSSFKNDPTDLGGSSTPDVTKQKYTQPSSYSQVFNRPMADFETKANIQGVQAGTDAQNQQDVQNDVSAKQAGLARRIFSGVQPNDMSNLELSMAAGNNYTSPNARNVISSQDDILNNVPSWESAARKEGAESSQRQLFSQNQLNYPEWKAQADANLAHNTAIDEVSGRGNINLRNTLSNQSMNYDLTNLTNRIGMQPVTMDTERNMDTADNIRSAGALGAAPSEAQDRVNTALLHAGFSQQQVEHIAMLQKTAMNQLNTDAMYSAHPAPMSNIAQLNPDGTISRNPEALGPMQTSMMGVSPASKPVIGQTEKLDIRAVTPTSKESKVETPPPVNPAEARKPIASLPSSPHTGTTNTDPLLKDVSDEVVQKNSTIKVGDSQYQTNSEGAIVAGPNANIPSDKYYYAGQNRWFPVLRNPISTFLNTYTDHEGNKRVKQ